MRQRGPRTPMLLAAATLLAAAGCAGTRPPRVDPSALPPADLATVFDILLTRGQPSAGWSGTGRMALDDGRGGGTTLDVIVVADGTGRFRLQASRAGATVLDVCVPAPGAPTWWWADERVPDAARASLTRLPALWSSLLNQRWPVRGEGDDSAMSQLAGEPDAFVLAVPDVQQRVGLGVARSGDAWVVSRLTLDAGPRRIALAFDEVLAEDVAPPAGAFVPRADARPVDQANTTGAAR
jgi:hypothetical protein